MSKDQPFTARALVLAAVEAAAIVADDEAQRLEDLASEIHLQIMRAPLGAHRRGLDSRFEQYKESAKAARRIANRIRTSKESEEEG
jgi:hypothetical protein